VSTACSYFELASEISSKLIAAAPESAEDEIRHALACITEFFRADCGMLFRAVEGRMELVHAAEAERIASSSAVLAAQQLFPQLFRDALRDNHGICLRVPDDLPAASKRHHARFAHFGIGPSMAALMGTGAGVSYLCAVVFTRAAQAWSKTQLQQFRLLAEMLAGAMRRRDLHHALQYKLLELTEAQRICRVGSWEWDLENGSILKMEGVERVLGVRPCTQAAFMEQVHAADRARLQKAIDDACAKEADEHPLEYRMQTRRGDIRIITSRFSLLHSAHGPRMAGSFHDVTNARRGEHELQLLRSQHWHADRLAHTGVLVSSLAHELSQPLAAILTNAQAGLRALERETLDRREAGDILQDIVGDSRRAMHVINALRAMIRREQTPRANIDVADIAHEILALLHSELLAQQVEVELGCGAGCTVLADKTQIEQVLLNLILNSMESMRGQDANARRLRLQVSRVGEHEVQVAVHDSGAGIPKDQLASVFEPFWTTKPHGIGMGLEVCRSIIAAHGGRIWAECNEDRGVTFLFRLPLSDTALEEMPAEAARPPPIRAPTMAVERSCK
jgi:two-component system sensor kinase FixL